MSETDANLPISFQSLRKLEMSSRPLNPPRTPTSSFYTGPRGLRWVGQSVAITSSLKAPRGQESRHTFRCLPHRPAFRVLLLLPLRPLPVSLQSLHLPLITLLQVNLTTSPILELICLHRYRSCLMVLISVSGVCLFDLSATSCLPYMDTMFSVLMQ